MRAFLIVQAEHSHQRPTARFQNCKHAALLAFRPMKGRRNRVAPARQTGTGLA